MDHTWDYYQKIGIENFDKITSFFKEGKEWQSFKIKPFNGHIEINEWCVLSISKNSFLLPDGQVYEDSLTIDISISNDFKSLFYLSEKVDSLPENDIQFLIQYKITGAKDEKLTMNKGLKTRLDFHPSLGLHNSFYGSYKSETQSWDIPVKVLSKSKTTKETEGYIWFIDYMADDTIYYDSDYNVIKPEKLTKTSLVNYYIYLNNSPYIYVSERRANKNVFVDMKLHLNKANGDINKDFTKVYLFAEDLGHKSVQRGKYYKENVFSFNSLLSDYLYIPINRPYKLLCYEVAGDKVFYNFQEKIQLQEKNLLEIELKEISFDDFIKMLEEIL
jgi:hypothetical protein